MRTLLCVCAGPWVSECVGGCMMHAGHRWKKVHFSMFHWPQQYCKPLHIHSSRIATRTTDIDGVTADSCPGHPHPPTHTHILTSMLSTHHLWPLKKLPCRPSRGRWPYQLWCVCSALIVVQDFCLHQQKSRGDNFLEFGPGLPLSRFARSWLTLALALSLRKGRHLRGLTWPEEFR